MAISLTIKEKGKLKKNLLLRGRKFKSEVRKEFVLAGDEFISKIRSRWYSGRPGLNQDTRKLHDRWISEPRNEGLDVVGVVRNPMNYGLVHERGSSKRNIPKRTFVTEDMRGSLGKDLYTKAVKRALRVF